MYSHRSLSTFSGAGHGVTFPSFSAFPGLRRIEECLLRGPCDVDFSNHGGRSAYSGKPFPYGVVGVANLCPKAHTHARNAVLETRKSNPVAASEEHDLAAGEFATAAQSSSDQEALRTLQLLEQHHKKLAEILRFQHEHPASMNAEFPNATISPNPITQPTADAGGTRATTAAQDVQGQPPRLPGTARIPSRESSSIASNLASARGIPAHPRRGSPVSPTLSSQQAGAKMTETPTRIKTDSRMRDTPTKNRSSRVSAPRQPWSPPLPSPTEITSQQVVPADTLEPANPKSKPSTADDSFQRFYSTFEGLISKISAPLAFAGLPLGSEDPSKAASTSRKSAAEAKVDRHHAISDRATANTDPDVSRIFSRAALRSIRESGTSPGNTAESFYVVPTTGGTMSYAGIMTRAEKEARRNSLDDAEDDFVDARETPPSPEMRQTAGSAKARTARRKGAADKLTSLQNPKTLEELQMENQALKHLSDTLSKRLHMWEVNAQSSSMALQQSLRAMHHQNTGSPEQLAHGSSANTSPVAQLSTAPTLSDSDNRVRELEDLVRRGEQELERVGLENDKLKNVLGRYRDRWEKLKEGAKTRRAEGRSADGQSNPPTPNLNARNPDSVVSPHPDTDNSATRNTFGFEAENKKSSST
ncbi:uncharacterized protein N7459_008016 [Penicillium hispanicum]|uniref:uncharacterized protein n=1 Tax=Penicillium hispanicum TaxID=1080232 RepID=UPI00253FAC82|nr:uncharacterized protein N7459_008016 [Penicillium hispanicum]KAJ5573589.1 hypothetical protein N7459_008016 [Penicillium hispanicum]